MPTVDLGLVVGSNGQGVPTGGSAGQILAKNSSSNYDTGWVPMSAAAAAAFGIVENGNAASQTIAAGQYVIWKGVLYTADAAIASGTTLAASGGNKNLTAVSSGGLNALNSDLSSLGNIIYSGQNSSTFSIPSGEFTSTSTITLTKGTWLVVASSDWQANANGYRQISFGTALNPGRNVMTSTANGFADKETYQQVSRTIYSSGETILTLYALQNSGSTINLYPYLYATKIGI